MGGVTDPQIYGRARGHHGEFAGIRISTVRVEAVGGVRHGADREARGRDRRPRGRFVVAEHVRRDEAADHGRRHRVGAADDERGGLLLLATCSDLRSSELGREIIARSSPD